MTHAGGTLEITTVTVCRVDCHPVCPQRAFRKAYLHDGGGRPVEQILSIDNFRRAVDKVPRSVRINFAGFADPCLNPKFPEMLEYAKAAGHPVDLFTTFDGASLDWIPRIAAAHPDHLEVHTPDNHGIAHLPANPEWEAVFAEAHRRLDITGWSRMSAANGFVNNLRAGNVEGSKPPRVVGPFYCSRLTPPDFILLPNLDVQLCCMDWRLKHRIGNLGTQTWQEMLDSPERQRVLANRHRMSGDTLCRTCTFAVSVKSIIPRPSNASTIVGLAREFGQKILATESA